MSRTPREDGDTAAKLVHAAERLRDELRPLLPGLASGEATHVLQPLDYAWENHRTYLARHARAGGDAVLLGMNPGPWGMGQTGVPFGDPTLAREFLGIDGPVAPPAGAHPRVPILGLASPRGEVSGRRLWGGARACFGAPGPFFARFFVGNYCPLLFLAASGRNVTPDKLPADRMAPVLDACDRHLRAVVQALAPRRVIGIGAWVTRRLERTLPGGPPVGTVLHPSPASPAANKGWLDAARRQLSDQGCPWPEPGVG